MKQIILNNPAVAYFLSKFRDEKSSTYECCQCVETISFFLAGELSKFLLLEEKPIKTPLGEKCCSVISEEVVLIPVLRAGVSMLNGFQRILPKSRTGFIWAHRDKEAKAVLDKYKFPSNIQGKTVILLDTMLATAGTINLCSEVVKDLEPRQVLCASILSTQRGVERLSKNVAVLATAEISDQLDGNLYISPGVGDAGDRLYG